MNILALKYHGVVLETQWVLPDETVALETRWVLLDETTCLLFDYTSSTQGNFKPALDLPPQNTNISARIIQRRKVMMLISGKCITGLSID